MTDRWYGPGEQWPAHPKPWWRDALARARAAGWHLQVFAGHGWGKVVCGRAADDPCTKVIFATGRSGENHAKDLIRLIQRCRHGRDSQSVALAEAVTEAGRLLDGAQLLLDAAENCLAAEADAVAAEELLEIALGNVTAVEDLLGLNDDELIERAVEFENKAQTKIIDARTCTAAAGYPPDEPVRAPNLADAAERRIDAAAAATDDAPGIVAAQELKGRVHGLRDRVDAIRSQLTERLKE